MVLLKKKIKVKRNFISIILIIAPYNFIFYIVRTFSFKKLFTKEKIRILLVNLNFLFIHGKSRFNVNNSLIVTNNLFLVVKHPKWSKRKIFCIIQLLNSIADFNFTNIERHNKMYFML